LHLARSLFETLLFTRYFTEPCSDHEWAAKLKIMQLNDDVERMRGRTSDFLTTVFATYQIDQTEHLIRAKV
jgi:hypothetical protein